MRADRMTLRERLSLWAFRARWKAKTEWWRLVAPYKLHPTVLYGYEGEPPHFVRADLAQTQLEAAAYLASDSEMSIPDYGRWMLPVTEIKRVWMVEHVNVCTCSDPEEPDDDCEGHVDEGWYDAVPEQQPGAVAYWKWGGE